MKGFFRTLFSYIKTPKYILLLLGALYFTNYSFAQIATYDFENPPAQNGRQATNAVSSADANLTASDMSKGSGLTFVDSTPYNGGFTAYNWATGGSLNVDDYYEFTVSPNCGYEMTLNTIVFDEMHNDANAGDYNWTVRSSLDNYSTNIQAPVNVTQVVSTQTISTGNIVTLPAAFHNLTSAVTFRFYVYSVSPAGMEWGIDNVVLTSGSVDLLTDLHTVNFEHDGCGYETINSSKDNADTYFQRFAAAGEGLTHDFVTPVTGTQGQYYWAVESNEDLAASTGQAGQVIFPPIASPINAATFDNLQVKILIAAPGNNLEYDTGDSLAVHYTFDGGVTYRTIGAFYGNGSSPMYQDTDLDGAPNVSVPNELDENLTEFTFNIPKKGSNLNLRVIAFTTAGSEELAFDNIRVQGVTDVTAPEITSITRQTPTNAITNASSVTYRVTFNEGVLNVGTADFTLSGAASGTIASVTPISSTVYDVLVNTVAGDGNLNLDISVSQDITDIAGVAFAGTINSEEEYTIDNTAPEVTSIIRQAPLSASTTATSVTFRVTFDEPVVNVGTADFTLSGTASGSISTVTPNSTTEYDVLVNTVSGNSDNLNLDFAGGQNVADNVGNAFIGTINAEEEYTIDNVAPSVLTVGNVVTTGGVIVANYWNSSNSGLSITVPLDAGDATLDNGSIQLQARVDAGTFENLGPAVTILNIDRTNGFKIVTIADNTPANGTADTEEITGFVEEGTIEFRAQVSDNPGNTSTYTASATQLAIDQTLPTISPDEISLISAGEITFTLSEQLNFGPGVSTGFSTNDGTLSSQNYSGVGTSNTITMLGSGWSLNTVVSYTGAGNIVDLAGNPMAAVVNHPVTFNVINMSAGDAAFTYFRSDDPNEFAFVLLKDIPIGTQIKFTNNGWDQNSTSFRTSEETLIWEADANYYAGLEVKISGVSPTVGTVTGDELTLSTDGDQIFAYQGTSINPTFIAGIHTHGGWDSDNNNQQNSMRPTQLLTTPPSSFAIAHVDNLAYNRGVLTGTVAEILTDINSSGNWDSHNNPANVTAPTGGLTAFVLPPSVDALIPANSSTIIASTTTLQIDFNENMAKGPVFGGNVTISISGGAAIASIPVGSGLITVNNDIVSIDISGLTLNDGVTYEVDVDGFLFQNADENHNVPIDGATEWSFTADGVAPTVSSINRGTATPLNANFGTTASSVTYTVVFSEDVNPATVTTADFTTKGAASGGTETVSNVTGTGDTYTVTVSSINKLGDLTIEFNALGAGAVTDLVGNVGTTYATGDQSFYIINPEPSQQSTNLIVAEGANNFSLDLSWTAGAGTQLADGYLILYKTTAGSFPADPTDLIAQGNTFNGINGVLNLAASPTPSTSISGLNSGVQYDFKIYPYTNSGNQIDYKTDATILTGSGTTSTGNDTRLYSNTDAASMSSLINSLGSSINNFSFYVYDDDGGFGADNDNAPTLINSLTFNLGTGNSIDWADAIEGVELNDNGVNVWNSDVNGGNIIIDNTQITFNNIPTGVGQLGYLADDAFKLFNLKIWLKSPITDATLRNEIDGKNFAFNVSNSSFGFAVGSSGLIPAQSLSSGPARNVVTVVATDLNWEIQPPATAGVQAPFTSQPVIEAVDVNGNRDVNYSGTIATINNAGGIGMNNSPVGQSFASGFYTFDNTVTTGFNYQDAGDGTLTVTSGTLNPSPASDPVTVSYSDGTTITAGGGSEPSTISSLQTGSLLQVFDFTINDDVSPSLVNDAVATRINQIVITPGTGNEITDWSEVIQEAVLRRDLGIYGIASISGTINTTDITFASITNNNIKFPGYVGDDLSGTFQLYIRLKSNINAPFSYQIDGQKFVFELLNGGVVTNLTGSSTLSASSTDSGPANNSVSVDASQLVFTQQPPATVNAQVQVTPQPVVQAQDVNGNRDKNFGESIVNVSNARTPSQIPMTDEPTSADQFVAGELTFASTFSYDEPSLINGDAQLTLSTASFTVVSDPVTVVVSQLSDIIEDGGFTYPTNVDFDYLDYDTESAYLEIARFIITDGGDGNGNDSDNAATKLTSLTLNFANFNSIREVGIYDGGSLVSAIKTLDPSGNVTFAGAELTPIVASDNGTKSFNVRVNFNQTVVDNEQFTVKITAAEANPLFSRFAAPDAGGAITTLGTDDNKIEVDADRLNFTTTPGSALSAFTDVSGFFVVEAQDINGNTDIDYTSSIGTVTTQNFSPINPLTFNFVPSGNFDLGVYNFSIKASNFQIETDGMSGELVVSAPTLTDGISSTFDVFASNESDIILDPSFIANDRITTTSNRESDGTPATLARFIIRDGGVDLTDADAGNTVLKTLDISILNFENLEKVGIYDATNALIEEKSAAATITFDNIGNANGLEITATDIANAGTGFQYFFIKATLKDSPLDDTELIQITLDNATVAGGSQFTPIWVPSVTPSDKNIVDVVATEFRVNTQPNTIEGLDAVFTATPVIYATDDFGSIDIEVDESFSPVVDVPTYLSSGSTVITAPINIDIDALGTVSFVDGVLSGDFIRYKSTGNGTLTVTDIAARGISTTVTTHVDVINTVVSPLNDNVTNNIRTNASPLNTGSSDVPIYGLQFNADYFITGQPKLNQITINFRHQDLTSFDVRNVFDNFRVFRSNDSYVDISAPLSDDVLVTGLSIIESANSITISGFNEVFDNDIANQNLFLVANVKLTAAIEIALPDYIEAFTTKSDITLSNGSSSLSGGVAELTGLQYTFNDEENPVISALNPLDGEPLTPNNNVNIATDFDITFNEPMSFSGLETITLRKTSAPGFSLVLGSPTISPDDLTFTFDPPTDLEENTNYYVQIGSSVFADKSGNFFAGINNSTSWNFKSSDATPPVFVSPSPLVVINKFDTGFELGARIDEEGEIHYIVVEDTEPIPGSSSEVFNDGAGYGGTIADSGVIQISLPNEYHYVVVTGLSPNTDYTIYAVAQDNANPVNKTTSFEQFDVTTNSNSGSTTTVVNNPAISICQGDYQRLIKPITIREGGIDDFDNGNNQSILFALPTGFEINTASGLTNVQTSGSDISNAQIEFVNSTIFRVKYDIINTTNDHAIIIINNLEIKAINSTANGSITRIGGTAEQDGNSESDAQSHAQLSVSAVPNANFTFQLDGLAISTVAFSDTTKLDLVAEAALLVEGLNTFTGDAVVGEKFFVGAAGLGDHDVTLTHTTLQGCQSAGTETISVFDNTSAVPKLLLKYCEGGGEIVSIGENDKAGYRLTNLYPNVAETTANPSAVTQVGNNYTIDIDLAASTLNGNEGTVTLTLIADYVSKTDGTVTLQFSLPVKISAPPQITFGLTNSGPINSNDFCEDGTSINLEGEYDESFHPNVTNDFQFGSTVTGINDLIDFSVANSIASISPQDIADLPGAGYGSYIVNWTLTDNDNGCSNIASSTFTVNQKPTADFTYENTCFGEPTVFTNNSVFPLNDPLTYAWNFDDLASGTESSSNLESPNHTFTSTGFFDVNLKITSELGCTNTLTESIAVGGIPNVNFNFTGTDFGDDFTFTSVTPKPGTLPDDKISKYIWSYGDTQNDTINASVSNTSMHTYLDNGNGPLIDSVKLTVISTYNCKAVFGKQIAVLDTINVFTSPRISKGFDEGTEGWTTLTNIGNSWTLSNDPGFNLPNNNNVWVTNPKQAYLSEEKSNLYSASLNLIDVSRPLVQFDAYWELGDGDGVILEYSVDNLNITDSQKVWNIVGGFQSGDDWYNGSTLDYPQQTLSRNSWAGSNFNGQPKNVLDGIPITDRGNVIFRFTILSDRSTPEGQGFAFDNFFIGERTRTVLLENFTNTSDATIKPNVTPTISITKYESDYLKNFSINDAEGTILVKINYHTDFPGNDPINIANKVDPSARALFYDVTSTPKAIIDGMITDPDGRPFSQWGETSFNLRSLILAQYKIDLNVTTSGGAINIEAIPTPQNNSVIGKNTIMLAAVLEKDVDLSSVPSGEESAEFVLRKLLPNAAGKVLNTANASNGQPMAAVNFSWIPNNVVDLSDLAVVVIIQDEDTKEVYQSELWLDAPTPEIVTAVEEANNNLFSLYPNPASDQVHILISPKLGQNSTLRIYDNFGKVVYEHAISETDIILDTKDFASGMYHVQVTNEDEVIRKRLIISHSDR